MCSKECVVSIAIDIILDASWVCYFVPKFCALLFPFIKILKKMKFLGTLHRKINIAVCKFV